MSFTLCVTVLFSMLPFSSYGIVNIGNDIELEGFIQAQNIVRTPDFEKAEGIMQRNTAQLEGKYYFLRDSTAFKRFNTGPIEEATLTFIWRSHYDSIYEMRNSYDEAFGAGDGKHGERRNSLREVFVDIILPPFSLRLGRQQVVWGETNGFRALDVINPLDLSWHWSRESWEDIRIPLWMVRGIYDIGKLWKFEESFVEALWIPADFRPNKVSTDPRRPWAFTGAGLNELADSVIVDGELFNLDVTVRDRQPDRALDDGQAGVRFKAILGEIDFSLNYFYGFAPGTGVRVRNDLGVTRGDTVYSYLDTVNPRSHVLGLTANYSEERFTQSVLRLETTFTTGLPVTLSEDAPESLDPDNDQFDTARRTVVMLAMDRPTWIRALNKNRTFFLSTQIFWRRWIDYSPHYRGMHSVVPAVIDGRRFSGRFVSERTDRIDQNEFVMTFFASTSYGAAGLIRPSLVWAFDPRSTGAYNRFQLEYLYSDHIIFRFKQDIYWEMFDNDPGPWALGDIWGQSNIQSRHETNLSVIFQF